MGQALMVQNKPEEAIEKVHKAVQLDPLNDTYKALYTMCLYFAKHYDEAYSFIVEAQKKNSKHVFLNSSLRAVYHAKKMYNEEFESWVNKYSMTGDTTAVRELKLGYELGGYELALQKLAEHLIKNFNYTPEFIPAWQIATLYTRIGKKEEALRWLEKAYEIHSSSLPFIYIDPLFDYMRDDPRFISLVNKMNLHL
jgi:tetratricopeptide (TPR) repeat protein